MATGWWESFGSVSWTTREDVDSAALIDSDGRVVDVPEDLWNSIVVPQTPSGTAHVLVHLGRWGLYNRSITLSAPCTLRNVLTCLHDFYRSRILDEKSIEDLEDDDVFDYKVRVVERLRTGENPANIELMGDRVYFEGVHHVKGDVYEIELGS